MKVSVLSLVLLAGLVSTIITRSQTTQEIDIPFAAPENPGLPRMIRVHAEFIEMPHATYTTLMAKPRSGSNDTDLRQQCANLIDKGEARMAETLCVNATPGQNATSEAISEYVYPTEYDYGDGGFYNLGNEPAPTHFPVLPFAVPHTFHSYETKNTGSTFEVEAQIDANAPIVELRFTPTIVSLSDNIVWSTWKNKETSIDNSTPFFYVLTAKTGVSVVSGEPLMVSALSPQDAKGFIDPTRKIMLFVRADIITVGQ